MADLLVLGGTSFVGRATVADALAAGHAVTTLNRGRTGIDLPGVRVLHADRNDPESMAGALAGVSFDAVIDVSGMAPRQVAIAADLLRDRVAHYALVSTISLYAEAVWESEGPIREDAPR